MKKVTQFRAALALGLSVCAYGVAEAQQVVPSKSAQVPADLGALAEQLGARVRALAKDLGPTPGLAPTARPLEQDAQELAQAVGEFQATVAARREPFALR